MVTNKRNVAIAFIFTLPENVTLTFWYIQNACQPDRCGKSNGMYTQGDQKVYSSLFSIAAKHKPFVYLAVCDLEYGE